MGIFDERRTYIASSTLSLIEDTPDYIRQSILNSILAGRDIVPDLLDSTLNSFAQKDVGKMYRYAKNQYTNGLPEGSKGYAPAPYNIIEQVLKKEFPELANKRVEVQFAAIGPPVARNVGIERLVQDSSVFKGWVQQPGMPTFPDFFFYNDGYGYNIENAFIHGAAPIYLRAYRRTQFGEKYIYLKWNDYHEPLFNDHPQYRDYYNVEFKVFNPDGSPYVTTQYPTGYRYWTYYPPTNRYPELALGQRADTFYFPVVPLRVNKVSYTSPDRYNTPLYKTSKKLLKYIDVDIEDLHEGVNNSPDIADVNHAYVIFGIDVHTKSQPGMKYLFEYWEDEYARSSVREGAYTAWIVGNRYSHPPLNEIHIQDDTYNVSYAYSYIKIVDTNGVIGQVGDVSKWINIADPNPQYSYPPGMKSMAYEHHMNVLYIRRQETPTMYRTIEVHGLCQANNIHGSGMSWWTGLWGAVNLAGGNQQNAPLVIPLNVAIAYDDLRKPDANRLYYEALKIVFNSFQVAELKWYETSFFQFVTQIISVAITVVTGGMNTLINSLTVAVSSGVIATSVFIAKLVVGSALAGAAFSFVAEEYGFQWAAALAAIAAIYGAAGSKGMLNLPFADELLFIGEALAAASKEFVQETSEGIVAEYESLSAEYDEKQAELDKINKSLQPINLLDPLGLYAQVGMSPFDTPSSFIERSLAVNTGIQTIDAVSNFVDNSLRLPQI